jgi:lipoprotein-anchoring transpeptidase ErfK/SrfK
MNNHKPFSRRQFLQQSATALCGFALTPAPFSKSSLLDEGDTQTIGRVLFDDVPTFSQPDSNATRTGTHQFNDILQLSQPISADAGDGHKAIWFATPQNGYIQSINVQVVQNQLNIARDDVPKSGRLAEVTVPLTEAWPADKQKSRTQQIFFYGSVHWVYGLGKDADENLYYLVIEDRWNETYYVDATHMRIIEDDELAPISPTAELGQKEIVVDTARQMLFAYQDNHLVMACGISTGVFNNGSNLSTPAGEYFINYKRPTRHMVHSDKIGINDSELYGVPWVSYFTNSGIAFHGTYWHNDYTQPRSHGCVNMPIQDAKWLYLWSDPIIEPRAKLHVSRYGTSVKVI